MAVAGPGNGGGGLAVGYYPVYLEMEGRPCVVIGGGEEVERKARELVEAGARVTLICKEPSSAMEGLAREGALAVLRRDYQTGDLAGAFLAIAGANDDLELCAQIAREAREERALLNVVDVTSLCTWIAPAVVRRGSLTLAIATGGKSPAMARRVREELERLVPAEYAELLEIVSLVRTGLRRQHITPSPEAWQRAMDEETMRLLGQRDWDGVQERLVASLTESIREGRA